jgi:hypothetical protein
MQNTEQKRRLLQQDFFQAFSSSVLTLRTARADLKAKKVTPVSGLATLEIVPG